MPTSVVTGAASAVVRLPHFHDSLKNLSVNKPNSVSTPTSDARLSPHPLPLNILLLFNIGPCQNEFCFGSINLNKIKVISIFVVFNKIGIIIM